MAQTFDVAGRHRHAVGIGIDHDAGARTGANILRNNPLLLPLALTSTYTVALEHEIFEDPMSVLFGHPTGNPNAHHAALAYFEAGILECICVSWIPSRVTMSVLNSIKPLRPVIERFGRRQFPALANAPKVQRRFSELSRLSLRALSLSSGDFSDEGNQWLMHTMVRECHRLKVNAVHAYEDCSLWPFSEATRLGKARIYDLPMCYYAAWERTRRELNRKYPDWLSFQESTSERSDLLERKCQEIKLANLTLVPSSFADTTVREFHPHHEIAVTPYGVDLDFWTPRPTSKPSGPLRFVYAGHLSLRKGTPFLIDAWSKAALRDAELELIGPWQLAEDKRRSLPPSVSWRPPCPPQALRDRYRESDVFVFPSFADGFGLVLLEAMACGLPAIASHASAGPDVIIDNCGRVIPSGDLDALVEQFRWFDCRRDELPALGRGARARAERYTWGKYRRSVTSAVLKFS